jgi:hypothetical protein
MLRFARFSRPAFLKKLDPDLLRRFLEPHREYFTARGVRWEDPCPSDYGGLAGALLAPTPEFDPGLAGSLEMIDALSTADGRAELLAECGEVVTSLHRESDSPGDTAMRVWMEQPEAVERCYAKYSLDESKSLVVFAGTPGDRFLEPTAALLAAMEEGLGRWFEGALDGPGCRVSAFPRPDGFAFLIRHGEPVKKVGVWAGKEDVLVYRPERADVAFLDGGSGVLRVSGRNAPVRDLYRLAFGEHLFRNGSHFRRARIFTLEPLRKGPGSIDCEASGDFSAARLVEIHFSDPLYRENGRLRSADVFATAARRAPDLFAACRLDKARIRLRPRGGTREKLVELSPARSSAAGRADDEDVERWLCERGFIVGDDGGNLLAVA